MTLFSWSGYKSLEMNANFAPCLWDVEATVCKPITILTFKTMNVLCVQLVPLSQCDQQRDKCWLDVWISLESFYTPHVASHIWLVVMHFCCVALPKLKIENTYCVYVSVGQHKTWIDTLNSRWLVLYRMPAWMCAQVPGPRAAGLMHVHNQFWMQ